MTIQTRPIPKALIFLFFYGIFLLLFVPIRTPMNFYDEGFAVFNATRVLDGELPYQDFWAIYPPGQLYALAGVYKLFGITLLASRLYDTLVRFALVLGFFLFARKVTNRFLAYLATLGAALMMASVGFYAYAVYPALALGMFALWSTIWAVETKQLRWLVAGGVLAGITSFFRWDLGMYGMIGLSAALGVYQLADRWHNGQPFLSSLWSGVKFAARFLLPAGLTALVLYGLVAMNSGLKYVWDQVFWFPATQLHDVRWLAYPKLIPALPERLSDFWFYFSPLLEWFRFYLPLGLYAVALVYLIYNLLFRRLPLDAKHFGLLAAAFFGLMAFGQALSRYDHIHALPTGLFALAVLAGLTFQSHQKPAARYLWAALIVLLPAIISVYFLSNLDSVLRTLIQTPPWNCYSSFTRASCAYAGETRLQALNYLLANTRADDPIYVGNQRHDMIFVNDVGFYFLAGRPSATRYSELHPGVATTRPVQQEIILELESKQVPYLVLVDIWLSQEPNESAVSSGVADLDTYIHTQYRQVVEFGEYQVWRRVER